MGTNPLDSNIFFFFTKNRILPRFYSFSVFVINENIFAEFISLSITTESEAVEVSLARKAFRGPDLRARHPL